MLVWTSKHFPLAAVEQPDTNYLDQEQNPQTEKKKKRTKKGKPKLTYILCCSAIFTLLLVKTAPKPNVHKHQAKKL